MTHNKKNFKASVYRYPKSDMTDKQKYIFSLTLEEYNLRGKQLTLPLQIWN